VDVLREVVAGSMHADELHEDIHDFFNRLSKAVGGLVPLKRQTRLEQPLVGTFIAMHAESTASQTSG
jgi:hypothetical protein